MLELRAVTRRYRTRTAVDDVSLTLETGRTYVLLGPNGSGKTTLMKLIAGLTLPDEGAITLDGQRIGAATRARIAYMPTENYFYPWMTVKDAGRWYADFYRDFDRAAFDTYLASMELRGEDRISRLSSGMSAKLRLALALSRASALSMLDEPLNGVDILTREQVLSAIAKRREAGRTLLISTHLVDELEPMIDGVIFMRDGRIVLQGSREELSARGSLTQLYCELYATKEVGAC